MADPLLLKCLVSLFLLTIPDFCSFFRGAHDSLARLEVAGSLARLEGWGLMTSIIGGG